MEIAPAKDIFTLTPTQLAKKRETDRKAQRNRREKTRQHIATLERQLDEISSANFFKELQQAKEHNAALEAENFKIKKRLGTLKSLMEEILADQEGKTIDFGCYLPQLVNVADFVSSKHLYHPHPTSPTPRSHHFRFLLLYQRFPRSAISPSNARRVEISTAMPLAVWL